MNRTHGKERNHAPANQQGDQRHHDKPCVEALHQQEVVATARSEQIQRIGSAQPCQQDRHGVVAAVFRQHDGAHHGSRA